METLVALLPRQAKYLLSAAFQQAFKIAVTLMEKDLVPDFLIRLAIRQLLAGRLAQVQHGTSMPCTFLQHDFGLSRLDPDTANPRS